MQDKLPFKERKTISKFRSRHLSLKKLSSLKKVSVYRNKSLSFIIHRFSRERPSFCLSRSKNVPSLDFSMTLLRLNIYGVLFVMIVTLDSIPFLVVVSPVCLSFPTKLRDCTQRFRSLALLFSALKEGPGTEKEREKKK